MFFYGCRLFTIKVYRYSGKVSLSVYNKYRFVFSVRYIINKFYCFDEEVGSLSTSRMGFFASIVNSWKLLSLNHCLSQAVHHHRYEKVYEYAYDN